MFCKWKRRLEINVITSINTQGITILKLYKASVIDEQNHYYTTINIIGREFFFFVFLSKINFISKWNLFRMEIEET